MLNTPIDLELIITFNSSRDGIMVFLSLLGGRGVAGRRRWPFSHSTPNLYAAMLACSTRLMLLLMPHCLNLNKFFVFYRKNIFKIVIYVSNTWFILKHSLSAVMDKHICYLTHFHSQGSRMRLKPSNLLFDNFICYC